jgi:hypothetical protein
VYKLIGVILAAVPIVLFLKAIMGQSRKRSQAALEGWGPNLWCVKSYRTARGGTRPLKER